jgi:hypothetical protein
MISARGIDSRRDTGNAKREAVAFSRLESNRMEKELKLAFVAKGL